LERTGDLDPPLLVQFPLSRASIFPVPVGGQAPMVMAFLPPKIGLGYAIAAPSLEWVQLNPLNLRKY